MKHNLNHIIPIKTSIVMLHLMLVAGSLLAQTEINSEPTAETEIICYAAQKQWVCAPADQKQQAHDKAMKLVEQKQANGIDMDSIDSSQVEIKTMDVNNDFSQQVQELPTDNQSQQNLLDEQIKDFVPRVDLKESKAETSVNQVTTTEATAVIVEKNASEPDVSIKSVENNPSQSNQFEYWQNNYPDKWSFQVIGTSNRRQLDSFLSSHDLLQSIHSIVKTQVNSADWWVVLVGLYDSRDQALSQRRQLPSELASQAWVRQIKTITGEAD